MLSLTVNGESVPLHFRSQGRRKKVLIDSFDRWLSAFSVFATFLLSSFPHRTVEIFAYLNIIQSAHKKFLGLTWLAYDINFRRRTARDLTLPQSTPSFTWRNLLASPVPPALPVGGGGWIICLIPALCIPLGIGQAASPVIPAETSIREQPAQGHLAPTLTAAQSQTARSLTEPPYTPSTAMESLQRRTITNAAEFVKGLKPHTPINVDLLECYLEGHPDPGFVSSLCVGLREGFRIGYLGPRTHTFYPNLCSTNQHPDILEQNLLTEVLHSHTAGPFLPPPPLKILASLPWVLSLKTSRTIGVQFSTSHIRKHRAPAKMLTSPSQTIACRLLP